MSSEVANGLGGDGGDRGYEGRKKVMIEKENVCASLKPCPRSRTSTKSVCNEVENDLYQRCVFTPV